MGSLAKTAARCIQDLFLYSNGGRSICTSTVLCAEPLKKKKRIDPAVVRAREERKKRKLEKQIRRLEKTEKQLKPLIELEVPLCIKDNIKERERKMPALSYEEMEERWLLQKEWARYRQRQHKIESNIISNLFSSQQKALLELKNESEELYAEALKLDFGYVPYETHGPVETPPNPDYAANKCTEGDFVDISRKWD